jgi:hypothetical protein
MANSSTLKGKSVIVTGIYLTSHSPIIHSSNTFSQAAHQASASHSSVSLPPIPAK